MNIIITGAANGIGFDTVLEFAKNNEHKILAISRNKKKLELLQSACEKLYGNKIEILAVDVTKINQQQIKHAINNFKTVDVLINNAGVLINKPFEKLSLKNWQETFNTNLFAAVNLVQATLPKLKKSKQAHIINIGSMGGFQGSSKYPGLSAYSASKAALANFTECFAAEFGGINISCNCLCLGAVKTNMLSTAFPEYKAPVTSKEAAEFIFNFTMNAPKILNGKVLPIALSNP